MTSPLLATFDDLYCVDEIHNSPEQERLKVWISEDIMREYQRF